MADINTQIEGIAGNASGLPEGQANAGTFNRIGQGVQTGAKRFGREFETLLNNLSQGSPQEATQAQTDLRSAQANQINQQNQQQALTNEQNNKFVSLEEFGKNMGDVQKELAIETFREAGVLEQDENGVEGFLFGRGQAVAKTFLDEPHEKAAFFGKMFTKTQERQQVATRTMERSINDMVIKESNFLSKKDIGTAAFKETKEELMKMAAEGSLNTNETQLIQQQQKGIDGLDQQMNEARQAQQQQQQLVQASISIPQQKFRALQDAQQELSVADQIIRKIKDSKGGSIEHNGQTIRYTKGSRS